MAVNHVIHTSMTVFSLGAESAIVTYLFSYKGGGAKNNEIFFFLNRIFL